MTVSFLAKHPQANSPVCHWGLFPLVLQAHRKQRLPILCFVLLTPFFWLPKACSYLEQGPFIQLSSSTLGVPCTLWVRVSTERTWRVLNTEAKLKDLPGWKQAIDGTVCMKSKTVQRDKECCGMKGERNYCWGKENKGCVVPWWKAGARPAGPGSPQSQC